MTDGEVTRALAIWGAIVSTATAAWTIYRDFRTGPRLRLILTCEYVQIGDTGKSLFDAARVDVHNVGSEPTTVVTVWRHPTGIVPRFRRATWRRLNFTQPFPTIPSGGHVTRHISAAKLVDPVLVFEDSRGRLWRFPRKHQAILNRSLEDRHARGLLGSLDD